MEEHRNHQKRDTVRPLSRVRVKSSRDPREALGAEFAEVPSFTVSRSEWVSKSRVRSERDPREELGSKDD